MRLPYKNETVFAGYVGNEPELRKLASGDATLSLRIVAKRSYREQEQWKTHEQWQTAVFYRKLAEQVAEAGIKKGSFVHVEGYQHTREWTNDQGQRKKTQELIVTDWHQVALPAAPQEADKAPRDPSANPNPATSAPTGQSGPKKRVQTPAPSSATQGFA
jgi:single stranded DNA-binding protein